MAMRVTKFNPRVGLKGGEKFFEAGRGGGGPIFRVPSL